TSSATSLRRPRSLLPRRPPAESDRPPSRELANPQPRELDRRALRLQAEVTRLRVAPRPAGDLLTVDPEPDLAVDAADVVVVPLADPLAEVLRGEAPRAVGRGRREWPHLRGADGKYVSVGREEVALL